MPITWIAEDDDSTPFPPTRLALPAGSQAPGLLAGGARLSTQRLEAAYRQGIFPWFSPGQPVLWWSPDPRMVLPVAQFKLSRSLRKTLQQFRQTPGCTVRMDSAFEQVIKACAQSPRQGQAGTWIVPAMQQAYAAWHRAGHVHSVETWIDGELVGGLYCVNIGRMVFGESMFARRNDASKIALAALVAFCRAHGVTWIDCQQNTQHLASLGATEVSRHAFEGHLAPALEGPDLAPWFYHDGYWAQLLSTAD